MMTARKTKPTAQLSAGFLSQSFTWMFAGLLLTAGIAYVVQSTPRLLDVGRELFLPAINTMIGRQLQFNLLANGTLQVALLLLVVVVAGAAGGYPAFYLSGFKPALYCTSLTFGGLHLLRVEAATDAMLASEAVSRIKTQAGLHLRLSRPRRH